jgi:hypothetical protein
MSTGDQGQRDDRGARDQAAVDAGTATLARAANPGAGPQRSPRARLTVRFLV